MTSGAVVVVGARGFGHPPTPLSPTCCGNKKQRAGPPHLLHPSTPLHRNHHSHSPEPHLTPTHREMKAAKTPTSDFVGSNGVASLKHIDATLQALLLHPPPPPPAAAAAGAAAPPSLSLATVRALLMHGLDAKYVGCVGVWVGGLIWVESMRFGLIAKGKCLSNHPSHPTHPPPVSQTNKQKQTKQHRNPFPASPDVPRASRAKSPLPIHHQGPGINRTAQDGSHG